jgi:hypothetical protein
MPEFGYSVYSVDVIWSIYRPFILMSGASNKKKKKRKYELTCRAQPRPFTPSYFEMAHIRHATRAAYRVLDYKGQIQQRSS